MKQEKRERMKTMKIRVIIFGQDQKLCGWEQKVPYVLHSTAQVRVGVESLNTDSIISQNVEQLTLWTTANMKPAAWSCRAWSSDNEREVSAIWKMSAHKYQTFILMVQCWLDTI